MSRPALPDLARLVAYEGNVHAARYVLRWHADLRRWTDETFRARWDGASALLGWWHGLPAPERPPLDDLSEDDARAFLAELDAQALARTTVRGYRHGASALTKALRAARTLPASFDGDYDPFKGVSPEPGRKAQVGIDERLLRALPPTPRARLELLVALLELGLSVPEACTRTWRDLDRERLLRRRLQGARGHARGAGGRLSPAARTPPPYTPTVRPAAGLERRHGQRLAQAGEDRRLKPAPKGAATPKT